MKNDLIQVIKENTGLAKGTGVLLLMLGILAVAAPAAASVSLTRFNC
jgi:uncharacterized membrane protein HdeD (DUF308 family)